MLRRETIADLKQSAAALRSALLCGTVAAFAWAIAAGPAAAAVTRCDTLAALPVDPHKVAPGVGFAAMDARAAVAACRTALKSDAQNPRLIFQLGRALERSGDYAGALAAYRSAADHGYAAAQNAMGALYQDGIGVTTDKAVAENWFKKAADQGYQPAVANLVALAPQAAPQPVAVPAAKEAAPMPAAAPAVTAPMPPAVPQQGEPPTSPPPSVVVPATQAAPSPAPPPTQRAQAAPVKKPATTATSAAVPPQAAATPPSPPHATPPAIPAKAEAPTAAPAAAENHPAASALPPVQEATIVPTGPAPAPAPSAQEVALPPPALLSSTTPTSTTPASTTPTSTTPTSTTPAPTTLAPTTLAPTTPPPTEETAAAPAAATDLDIALRACIVPEAQKNSAGALDDSAATSLLLGKCQRPWINWVADCVQHGDSKDSCIRKSNSFVHAATKSLSATN